MEGFSQECQLACSYAVINFIDICKRILSGDITMSDLHEVGTHRELMDRLCAAVKDPAFTSDTISEALDQRVEEFFFFTRRQTAYQAVCTWVSSHSLKIEGT